MITENTQDIENSVAVHKSTITTYTMSGLKRCMIAKKPRPLLHDVVMLVLSNPYDQ